jgi:hypothetical protein
MMLLLLMGFVQTEQAGIAVTLHTYIWEVLGSNFGQDTGYIIVTHLSSVQVKA